MTGQQLDVGEAELGRVRRRAPRRAPRTSAAGCPRAGSAATSRGAPRRRSSARATGRARAAPLEPLPVAPRVAASGRRPRRSCGGSSAANANGSALSRIEPSGAADLELVARAGLDARDEELPDARAAERAHRVDAPVPAVEVADDGDRAGVRRPDRERRRRRRRRRVAGALRAARTAPRAVLRRRGGGRARRASAGTSTGRGPCTVLPVRDTRPRARTGAAATRPAPARRRPRRGGAGEAGPARAPRGTTTIRSAPGRNARTTTPPRVG